MPKLESEVNLNNFFSGVSFASRLLKKIDMHFTQKFFDEPGAKKLVDYASFPEPNGFIPFLEEV